MAYKSLEDIDCCVKVSDTLEEWLYLMRNKGYRIDDSGKYLRIFPREQIGKIEERIRKVRIDLGKEKAILKRMGEMEQKEQMAEMAMAGKSLRNNAGQRKNLRKEGERLSVMQI